MILKKFRLLAIFLFALTATLAQAQNPPAAPATTNVLVTLSAKPDEGVRDVIMGLIQQEVRATVNLYLDGKIVQWYSRSDGGGVMLILNATSIADAKKFIDELPLRKADVVTAEYVELSPMQPLRMLMAEPAETP